MKRNTALKVIGAGIGVLAAGIPSLAQAATKPKLSFRNEDFYKNGKFDPEAGKDAIIQLMNYHGYPVFKGLREQLWISDYGLGQFTKLGLAAVGFINDAENSYMVQDLYLLPNQMLPEHYHVKTDKATPKMEGWTVRHGLSYVYGEGERTPNLHAVIPDFEKDNVTVWHETILEPGQTAKLNRPTARHWQFAGPEGAIITEAATYHDNAAVRHSDPKIVFP
jgi:D-lyxose ketol-isomerase